MQQPSLFGTVTPPDQPKPRKRFPDLRVRPSGYARGYDAQWQAIRRAFARVERPRCSVPGCTADGLSKRMHLDHRTPKVEGGSNAFDNLQWLCDAHHARKTVAERIARRNATRAATAAARVAAAPFPAGSMFAGVVTPAEATAPAPRR